MKEFVHPDSICKCQIQRDLELDFIKLITLNGISAFSKFNIPEDNFNYCEGCYGGKVSWPGAIVNCTSFNEGWDG